MSWQERPGAQRMRDGRLRLIHGPIDLIVACQGAPDRVEAAYRRAQAAFAPVLSDLVAELPRLRAATGPGPTGAVARNMADTVERFSPAFVTPMAAVAGAVADHLLRCVLTPDHGLACLHINNGGDIALWTEGPVLRVAICDDPTTGRIVSHAGVGPGDGIGGVATSGWRGRSQSLGIADAVTVLAATAALADAAATLIANAVDVPGHPGITRVPANRLAPDSDLGDRLVTTDVGALSSSDKAAAVSRGQAVARDFANRGLIAAAYLSCQGVRRTVTRQVLPRKAGEKRLKEVIHA
ncbi:UPF0280 family protein [Mesobacterium sp. TK19101]|uniref:UPF0280 family protein n=1 Tax=Mesobacterium hydrothermale TaxID=3111907 RepID=A0ABU6HHJ6_9RHOB|nr:UPF0280 family protein [Mesobacterium sp. TK19101]MEC3861249.1 UPF0280 family protein [Mesobacterium sp. TK19101]